MTNCVLLQRLHCVHQMSNIHAMESVTNIGPTLLPAVETLFEIRVLSLRLSLELHLLINWPDCSNIKIGWAAPLILHGGDYPLTKFSIRSSQCEVHKTKFVCER